MKRIFKIGVLAAAAVGVFGFGVAVLPAVVLGFVGLKAVDWVGGLVAPSGDAVKDEKAVIRERNAAVHRANVRRRYWDRRNGQWNLRSFPMDMYPEGFYVGVDGREVWRFSCSGMDNVVEGRVVKGLFRDRVEFSTVIRDSRKAEEMVNYLSEHGILGVDVVREDGGSFRIVSDNAVDINTVIKDFYPPKEMSIKREITTTRQYIVSGCRNYEEAVRKFKADPVRYAPGREDNVFVTFRDTVDGVADRPVGGSGMDLSVLQAGQYVINADTKEVYSRNVTVSAGIDSTDEASRSRAVDYVDSVGFDTEHDLVEDACVREPVLSDGLAGKDVRRYVECNGRTVDCLSSEAPEIGDMDASLVLRFGTLDELSGMMDGNGDMQGRVVLVDRDVPSAGEAEYVVTLPVDVSLVKELRMRNGEPEAIAAEYASAGVTLEDAHRMCVLDALSRQGHVSAELAGSPDLSGVLVNGVPYAEFRERMGMTEDGLPFNPSQWLADVSMIRSVDMDLDLKENTLVITSSIEREGRVDTRVMTKMLSDDDARALSVRGKVSDVELKELVLQSYPDCFLSYRDMSGSRRNYSLASEESFRGVCHEPLEAFVAGRRPETEKAWKERKAAEKKERQSGSKKKGSSKKV